MPTRSPCDPDDFTAAAPDLVQPNHVQQVLSTPRAPEGGTVGASVDQYLAPGEINLSTKCGNWKPGIVKR